MVMTYADDDLVCVCARANDARGAVRWAAREVMTVRSKSPASRMDDASRTPSMTCYARTTPRTPQFVDIEIDVDDDDATTMSSTTERNEGGGLWVVIGDVLDRHATCPNIGI